MTSNARGFSGFVILGVGYQWLFNGVNFIAFKIGGEAFHPLILAALRFNIAAILILPFAAWRWRFRPASKQELVRAALLGPIMLKGGQTLAIWGTHFLPAGVASVFGQQRLCFSPCSRGYSSARRLADDSWRVSL